MADQREVVLPNRLSPAEMFPAGDDRFRVYAVRTALGEQVRVIECGPEESRDIVVCVHGWGCSVYSYRTVMPLLADAGCRVVAFDLRGHGLSEKPKDHELYTIDALATQVRDIIDQIGIHRAIFVGHSMGSGTLARFTAMYPERVHALVLTAPVGFEKTLNMRAASAATPEILNPLLPRLVTRSVLATIVKMSFGNQALVTERDIDEYWAPSQFPSFSIAMRTALHTFDWMAGAVGHFNGIAVPLTVIYATKDTLVPPHAALRYETVVPHATFICLEGCGHAVPDEAPEPVARAVLNLL